MKESVLQAKLIARCRKAEVNNPDFFWVYSYPAGLILGYQRDPSGRVYSPQAVRAEAWRMVCAYLGAPLDCWKAAELPEVREWEEVGV